MQELPSELAGVNELYSAITGYNQNTERLRSFIPMGSYQEHALDRRFGGGSGGGAL